MEHPYGSYTPNRHLPLDTIIADIERRAQVLGGILNCTLSPDLDWVRRVHHACPDWVEKFFVTVPWRTIAPTYVEAVIAVLALLKQNHGRLVNYLECRLTTESERFREYVPTTMSLKRLVEQQKSSSTLVVPGQLGLRHRRHSVREARTGMQSSEFCLGTVVNGMLLLTHPERGCVDSLSLDCAGDEFDAPGSDSRFGDVPYFRFVGDSVVFGARLSDCDTPRSHDGSGSGFVPSV